MILGAGIGTFLLLKSFAKPPETQAPTALIQQVEISTLEPYSGQLDMVVSGSVVPFREINIAAEVAGRIKQKSEACEAGHFVTQGEMLLQIDDEDYRLDIQTLEADLLQARKRITENQQQIKGEKRAIELAQQDLKLQQQELQRNQKHRRRAFENRTRPSSARPQFCRDPALWFAKQSGDADHCLGSFICCGRIGRTTT